MISTGPSIINIESGGEGGECRKNDDFHTCLIYFAQDCCIIACLNGGDNGRDSSIHLNHEKEYEYAIINEINYRGKANPVYKYIRKNYQY